MVYFTYAAVFLTAYCLGSIPSSVWLGKWFYGTDIRNHGSKNAGAANATRVLGWKAGLSVLLIDVLKAFAAVQLFRLLPDADSGNSGTDLIRILLGLTAVGGHIFPVFAGFRGGKGVATLLGVALTLTPWACLICLGLFLVVVLLFRIVSLGSLLAGIFYPLVLMIFSQGSGLPLKIFSLGVTILLVITHGKNIQRLFHGEESRIQFR